jgi:type IX secretion system PorP/SprF family membrane protein
MSKKWLLVSFVALTAVQVQAQQLQVASNYDLQASLFNPSYAGAFQDETVTGNAGASYRQQWANISGAPASFNVFGSFRLANLNAGIGASLFSDKTGPTMRNGVLLNLAKHIPTRKGGLISLGIESRLQQYRVDYAVLTEALANDPLLGGVSNATKYDAGFGISYTDKNWQLGASVSQLIQSKLNLYTGNLTKTAEGRLYRHYYFNGLYRWNTDDQTAVIPSLLVIYLPNAPVEVNGGVRVEHNKTIWWSIGYRRQQSWMLSAGVNIRKHIMLGYTYDNYTNPLNSFDGGNGAHEIMLCFRFLNH